MMHRKGGDTNLFVFKPGWQQSVPSSLGHVGEGRSPGAACGEDALLASSWSETHFPLVCKQREGQPHPSSFARLWWHLMGSVLVWSPLNVVSFSPSVGHPVSPLQLLPCISSCYLPLFGYFLLLM